MTRSWTEAYRVGQHVTVRLNHGGNKIAEVVAVNARTLVVRLPSGAVIVRRESQVVA